MHFQGEPARQIAARRTERAEKSDVKVALWSVSGYVRSILAAAALLSNRCRNANDTAQYLRRVKITVLQYEPAAKKLDLTGYDEKFLRSRHTPHPLDVKGHSSARTICAKPNSTRRQSWRPSIP
jgi:predicted trehalose synthase